MIITTFNHFPSIFGQGTIPALLLFLDRGVKLG